MWTRATRQLRWLALYNQPPQNDKHAEITNLQYARTILHTKRWASPLLWEGIWPYFSNNPVVNILLAAETITPLAWKFVSAAFDFGSLIAVTLLGDKSSCTLDGVQRRKQALAFRILFDKTRRKNCIWQIIYQLSLIRPGRAKTVSI